MIHIVDWRNRHSYNAYLDQHFLLRHEVYVGERKWLDLAKPDGRERDQFDNEDAVYMLAIEGEQVVGGSRLIPSIKPHLLNEVFPHLASSGAPRAPEIYEWTRVHVAKDRREGRNRGTVTGHIFCAIQEYCLLHEIHSLTALVEAWWLPYFQEMGWVIRPLDLPHLIEGEWSIAVQLMIKEETLRTTRQLFGIKHRVLGVKPQDLSVHVGASNGK